MHNDPILDEQAAYYRARAGEYDEWFLRQGRYDRGPEHRTQWFAEAGIVERSLRASLPPEGNALELACGTGIWTRHLAESQARVHAVDASPEVLAINRERVRSDRVSYEVADLFAWEPPAARFDSVFFGFWLSHVPAERFDAFWQMVGRALKPSGKAFLIDSLLEPESTARDHAPIDRSGVVQRKLNDGTEYRIVKIFYEPEDLQQRLAQRGWTGWARSTGRFFVYGCFAPAAG